jgi:hypothetical protein
MGNEAFELAKRLALEDAGNLFPLRGHAFPENQLAELLKEGPWRIENPPFDLLPPLSVGQCCQFLLGIFKGWAILS